MSKHFKFRSIMSIIYAIIMLFPVTSVAFRCAYTIFNKNAYLNYSDSNFLERTEILTPTANLIEGKSSHFRLS